MTSGARLRVAVVGHGMIGGLLCAQLAAGRVPGAELVAVVNRSALENPPARQLDLDTALTMADLVVECASRAAVHRLVHPVTAVGADLLVTSVGAFLEPGFAHRLSSSGPGRVRASHGAIGGLDLLASARCAAEYERVSMRTIRRPATLIQQWMDPEEVARIASADRPIRVFTGSPDDAVRLFPHQLNIVAAVALAIGGADRLTVELDGDPDATSSTHRIEAVGPLGHYLFEVSHEPSDTKPQSSAITPYSVLHSIAMLTRQPPVVL